MLGGPRFLEILSQNEKTEASEAEDDDAEAEADSGEGHGLDANFSLRGSSRALTEVGAALHQTGGGSGIETGQKTVNPHDLEALPAYQAHENEEDGAPLIQSDAEMNDGLGIHQSVEDDEGIDMSMGYNTMSLNNQGSVGFSPINQGLAPAWSWGNLDNSSNGDRQHNRISGTGSEIDLNENSFDPDGSDIVQHNSSASTGSIQGRLDDFDNAIPIDDDGLVFEDPSPVPDIDDENQVDVLALQREVFGAHRPPQFQVDAVENEEIDEPAAEIHLGPSDELKMG